MANNLDGGSSSRTRDKPVKEEVIETKSGGVTYAGNYKAAYDPTVFPRTVLGRVQKESQRFTKIFHHHNKSNNPEIPPGTKNHRTPKQIVEYAKSRMKREAEVKFGEKGSGFSSKSGAQDFYKIRDRCLNTGTLFEDPEFPPTNVSLFNSAYGDRRFLWKRPGEIVKNPKLFVEGFSRFDVQQGELGDCWLLAATANLTLYKRLFFQIVPDDQEFDGKYAGIFHFRFWQYGRWVDVVVDDKLPTEKGELVYLHSTEKNEFWSALLEKAYAKLHGSYEALKGGSTCEAMEDFTGGVTEMYELNSAPPNLFKILQKAYERSSLLGCSIEPDPKKFEAQTPQGLVRGHAYSITKVKFLDIKTPNMTGKIPLLRLRNPWGNETEWNGAWSDNSPEWKYISEAEKKDLGLIFDDDGEFWMSFKDFQTHFDRLEICNLNPDSLSTIELHGKKKWEMSMFEGAWVRGITAGGCRNFLETFGNNPQYRITLTDVDEDDEENKCTLIIALMQKNRRILKASSGAELLTMGFAIYYLPRPDKVPTPLDYNFFKFNASVGRSPTFVNLREVSCRFKFPKGTYCIVPSTYEPNQEGDFLVRVFSEKRSNMAYDGPSFNLPTRNSYNEYDESEDNENDENDDDDSSTRYYNRDPPSPHRGVPSDPFSSDPSPFSNPYPHHGFPSSPFSSSIHSPFDSPFSHHSAPYPPNPYPNNPYPSYPSYPAQPHHHSDQPSSPYTSHYPSSPFYPQSPQPSTPSYPQYPQRPSNPRRSSDDDDLVPITSLFKRFFR